MIEEKLKNIRAKKMMLWFSMISMTMTFGGLTSAYVVSSNRDDWLKEFDLPESFFISTVFIVLSSLTFYLSKKALLKNNLKNQILYLWATFSLATAFLFFQIIGFENIVSQGYYFTGAESSITTSFIYVLVLIHLFHLVGGFLVLSIVIFNSYKKKYNSDNKLGFDLAETFWHFLDFLWLYLFVFLAAYN